MGSGLSKSRILAGLQCRRRLWLQSHRPDLAVISEETERAFEVGHAVGEAARGLYPQGVLIDMQAGIGPALAETRRRLATPGDTVLFEATFQREGVLVRADLLFKEGDGLRLVEVKASTSLHHHHVADAAVQAWVVAASGLPLRSVALAHIDNGFVLREDGRLEGLFRTVELDSEVAALLTKVPGWVRQLRGVLAGDLPAVEVGDQCFSPYACEFFGYCGRCEAEYPVMALPQARRLALDLLREGVTDLRAVPLERLASERQRRVWRATRRGEAELDPAVGRLVGALPYPRFYLDLETIGAAVPLWPGTRPYQQLPFQFSCHVQREPGSDARLEHVEFLDVSGSPPMQPFAESLLQAAGDAGPVIVYGSFEGRILGELALMLPELAGGLRAVAARLVDLLALVRDHYYHPAMMGSWSLKAVLPTVAPELDYGGLDEVRDGPGAQRAYAELAGFARADGTEPGEERRDQLRRALLAYCERDTLALVRLSRFLETAG